jgi:type I restriction enzyme S subunit
MSAITAKESRKMKKYAVLTREPRCFLGSFDFSWEQRKFSELVQIERGGSPRPIDDFITDAPNGLNWVKIGDAPTQGNYITKTAEKIRPEGLSKTREVHPGDLILSNSMSFGKPYIMGIDGCIHDGWLLIRNTYGVFDLTFLCHLLGTPQMLGQYRSLAAGSTVNNLNKELVGNTVVTIPSITEQRVLGDYLEQLDHLITLHQRKYADLCSPSQVVFSLLFATSTFSWEQRRFFELYERVSRKNDLTYGRNDIISVANMYFKPDSYITDDSYLLTYNIFELGDIAFEGNKSKNYAHGRFVENTIGNGIVSHVFDVFKPIMNPYDLLFWKYAINNERLMGSVLLRSTKASTMMTNLVATDFLQESFLVPTYPEQQKIGAFFQQLDHLITLHQRKPFLMKWRTSDANRNQTNRLVL